MHTQSLSCAHTNDKLSNLLLNKSVRLDSMQNSSFSVLMQLQFIQVSIYEAVETKRCKFKHESVELKLSIFDFGSHPE